MRVLHLHSGNLYGGVETLIVTLARCRHETPRLEMAAALCFEQRVARELRDEGIAVAALGAVRLRRPDTVWKARRALAAELRGTRPDVVVAHQSWPLALFGSTVRAAALPLVYWVHSAQKPSHWLDRLAWKVRPDLVLCNSRFTLATLPSTGLRAEVLYCPVLPPRTTARDSAIRRGLNTPDDHLVIAQVGRLEPFKGHAVCLRALAQLRTRSDWTYWIVGGAQRPFEQKYLDRLERDAAALGISSRIRFAGQREDVRAILCAADVLCQPNLEPEGFGLSAIESLYAGVPVIGSSIGGVVEIVDRTCGRLVPAGDAPALASALEEMFDPAVRRGLGERAPARAEALCQPSRQMRELERLLSLVVAGEAVAH